MCVVPDAVDQELSRALLDRALLRGTFRLRSGAVSDRYFDKYRVTCDPTLLAPVAAWMSQLMSEHAGDCTRIVAPELGAVPLATALSIECGVAFVIVREQSKSHGTANVIEGPFTRGERAVLVEDVVTSGGAALQALHAAREAGLEVAHALCLLDRGEGGRAALRDAGVELHALLTRSELDQALEDQA